MPQLPKARTSDILEMEADGELLVYDLRINKAYNLNDTSKIVFNACHKQMSFDELKRRHKFTDDLIYFALDELKSNNLIEGVVTNHFIGMNRREVIKRVGLACAVALPVVTGMVAPTAAMAASGCLPAGSDTNFNCSGTVLQCSAVCNSDPNITGECCSGRVTARDLGNSSKCVCA